MTEIAVVLDATGVASYVQGRVAVGELMTLVADEERHIGIPAACLAAAYADQASEVATALLGLLVAAPVVRVLPLDTDTAQQAGIAARDVGGDIATGHAVAAAMQHTAYYATTNPDRAAAALPKG